jgi:hypothetical protein
MIFSGAIILCCSIVGTPSLVLATNFVLNEASLPRSQNLIPLFSLVPQIIIILI